MCAICGCSGAGDGTAGGVRSGHAHHHDHDHQHAGDHAHERDHAAGTVALAAGAGVPEGRLLAVERDILAANDAYAAANRARLAGAGVFALNLLSSPGSGKTALLVRTVTDLKARQPIAVIEGDQQTENDAERIRATGVPAIQINTGRACHLDAHMVGHALDALPLAAGGLLFIENVGNLICPAAFDLGEAHRIVVLSVTEGEDKPLKYPAMFAAARLMLINKVDLLPYVDFDLAAAIEHARRVNPRIEAITVSARTGEGLPVFYAWIARQAGRAAQAAA